MNAFLKALPLLSLLALVPVRADAIVLQPDAAAGKDAHLWFTTPTANRGTMQHLTVNWGDSSHDAGLLEFNLTPYAGMTLTNATLTLYHEFNSDLGATFGLFRNTSSWDEATVTPNTAPAFDPIAAALLAIPDSNQGTFRSVDVTALTQGWLASTYPNFGITIQRTDQPNSLIYFDSSDHSMAAFHPALSLTFTAAIPEPSTYVLMLAGLGFIAFAVRRRKTSNESVAA